MRKCMAPLNGPPTKLHPKWSKLYRIVALKGVLATVEDSKTEESVTVHGDRLAFSRPRLIDETKSSASSDSPFRSSSFHSLHNLFYGNSLEQSTLPTATPVHARTPTPDSHDFLDQPMSQGKR